MSRHDYAVAQELIKHPRVTFTALIMAAIAKADRSQYKVLRDAYRDICHEYWDRVNGVKDFLRGENRDADAIYEARDAEAEIDTLGFRLPKL